jgi:predicted phage terminase large subunit-like protein|nr:MAG TPA: Large Terminase [Caudoviricetes sp.]
MKSLKEMQETALDATKPGTVNPVEMLRLEALTSFEKYTKLMFKCQYKRSFIVAEHHKKMFEVLQDVVDGKITRLIINIAPRYGKCVSKDTLITLATGERKKIADILPGDKVLSFKDGRAVVNSVIATEPAYKDCYEITMRSGRSVVCSIDHPWRTPFGYVKSNRLKIGDRIFALKKELDGAETLSDAEVILISMVLFDGCCTKSGKLGFTNIDKLAVNAVIKAVNELGGEVKHYSCTADCQYTILGGTKGVIDNILIKHRLVGNDSYTKRIPLGIFSTSMRQKYVFLGIVIATDGTIKKNGQLSIGLANKGLAEDIQYLLSTMKIPSTLGFYENEKAGIWNVAISRRYSQKLYPHLDFYGKADKAKEYILQPSKIERTCTYPYSIIKNEGLYKMIHFDLGYKSVGPNRNMSEDTFRELVEIFPDNLTRYWAEDFYPDEIVSIEEVGKHELVHIEVSGDKNFIANGLVSHNTELVIKSFISWAFALNPRSRFLHLSYSDILVNDNSDTVRNIMSEELYKTLFPNSALASEKGSAKRWKTKAGGELYAVSTQGQVTGFGAGAVDEEIDKMDGGNDIFVFDDHTNEMLKMIDAKTNIFQGAIVIDDPLKADDAASDLIRERINQRFENTIRNRVNSRRTPIIIIMQRLHEHDLCGYLQEIEPDTWTVLSLPVIQTDPETGEEHALWPMKHNLEELYKLREINPVVFETQYMQNPIPTEGLMYHEFRTYQNIELPSGSKANQRWCYVDTADTGSDYLCAICFINTPEMLYIIDVLYTQLPMEKTEVMLAKMLTENSITECLIESNNGGRQFARNVKRITRATLHNFKTAINTFTQTKNKAARIFSNSALVNSDVAFPENWDKKWREFYNAITTYRKDNKRRAAHDDAPDALTGVVEMRLRKAGRKKISLRN